MRKSLDPIASAVETALAESTRSVPSLRTLRRECSKQIKTSSGPAVLRLALRLLKGGAMAHRFIAYELILHHGEAANRIGVKQLKQLGVGLDSWAAVDTFACYLSGRAWRAGQITDAVIHEWAASPDRWRRRAALVSTVPLNSISQGGRGDAERTLAVCRLLLDDRDDMVVKAMSWALRELAKRNPRAVADFTERHRDRLAARVLREVGNKLKTGRKNPRPANFHQARGRRA
jgi:3-methyladenine DNA glycosylase AlkD